MTTYSEKLKDPRWQKKRLKVLERDKWGCQKCGNTEDTLNVHHLKYAKSGNPWDSPMKDLRTLCEGCHNKEREVSERIKDINKMVSAFNADQLRQVCFWCIMLDDDDFKTETIEALRAIAVLTRTAFKIGSQQK